MNEPPLHFEIETVNHALGVERGDGPYVPEHDPDSPRDEPHTSHEWRPGPEGRGWLECARCGVRDHWPAAEAACGKPTNGRTKVWPAQFRETLIAELDTFLRWWQDRPDTPETLPDHHEWAANFLEWRLRDPEPEPNVCEYGDHKAPAESETG